MKFKVDSIDVRVDTEFDREGQLKKRNDKIYIWPRGETMEENLRNRRSRPYKDYKLNVIPQLMDRLKTEYPRVYKSLVDVKWSWDKNCGCTTCPCSPGFVGDVKNYYPDKVYTIHVDVTIIN